MIVIKSPLTKEEFKAYYALRYRSLFEPYGQPKGAEKDDYEPISQHFMAIDDVSGEVVGVIKMHEKSPTTGQLVHLGVLEDRRGQGIGLMLINAVEQAALQKGYTILGAMARLTATDYFGRFGFRILGIPTRYFGTTQTVWMQKALAKG